MNPIFELKKLMEEISQDHYCAGWMDGLEFILWKFVKEGSKDQEYGMGVIKGSTILRLKELSEEAGGWWVFFLDSKYSRPRSQDYSGSAFIPMYQWEEYYNKENKEKWIDAER